MGTFKAVFFDLDGTLWDGSACACHALDILLGKLRDHLPEGEEDADVSLNFNAALLGQIRDCGLTNRLELLRTGRFQRLLDGYGIKDKALAHELAVTYNNTLRMTMRTFVRKGAEAVLRELRTCGLVLGIITDGVPSRRRQVIQDLGLAELVDHLIIGGAEGHRKPHPRLFTRALEAAAVSSEDMLYVGDSLVTDVVGACKAGIAVAWLRQGSQRQVEGLPKPTYTVNDLREVVAIAGQQAPTE